jgi:selenocysteine lyase/cysteine desulfurase
LRAVSAAGHAAIERTAAPWAIKSNDWFAGAADLRERFARLIGTSAANVALVPSVSYGVATAARNVLVRPGDNIVVIENEYPSNYYSWQRLAAERQVQIRVARRRSVVTLTDAVLSLVDARTAVIAVPNCHWSDGELVDLVQVGAAARSHDAALVVDASQSLGVRPLDVAAVQPDFLVSVGYKWLLGPYGLGYLYVAPRWQQAGRPLEESWLNRAGSESFATLADYTDAYRPGAQRFNQGESAQFQLIPMALAALTQIEAWSVTSIQERLSAWTRELCAHAADLGFRMQAADRRVGHMIGLEARGGLSERIATSLAERNVQVAVRGSSIRIAPHMHSTERDLESLVETLKGIVS